MIYYTCVFLMLYTGIQRAAKRKVKNVSETGKNSMICSGYIRVVTMYKKNETGRTGHGLSSAQGKYLYMAGESLLNSHRRVLTIFVYGHQLVIVRARSI